MLDNELIVVSANDYLTPSTKDIYRGKHTVGRFHLTDTFIVEYMKIIHEIEIPDSWASDSFPNISDTDTSKIMYMEYCDIISKDTINQIRNVVKSPPCNLIICRNGENIVKIEILEQ